MGWGQNCPSALLCATSLQACLTLCNPINQSLPGSFVHGILQARILEWVAISCSKGSSWLRNRTHCLLCPALAGRFFITTTTWEACLCSSKAISMWFYLSILSHRRLFLQGFRSFLEIVALYVVLVSSWKVPSLGSSHSSNLSLFHLICMDVRVGL